MQTYGDQTTTYKTEYTNSTEDLYIPPFDDPTSPTLPVAPRHTSHDDALPAPKPSKARAILTSGLWIFFWLGLTAAAFLVWPEQMYNVVDSIWKFSMDVVKLAGGNMIYQGLIACGLIATYGFTMSVTYNTIAELGRSVFACFSCRRKDGSDDRVELRSSIERGSNPKSTAVDTSIQGKHYQAPFHYVDTENPGATAVVTQEQNFRQ